MPANGAIAASAPNDRSADRRRDWLVALFLFMSVGAIYGARLGLQPLVGEETRWATGAREMLASGDWIVPRQQGHVFPERPPMTMWTMAVLGWLRGDVDPIAIRLPSVAAVVATCLVLYWYTRSFAPVSTALTAALIYATLGQVLQIGRLGESEAVFTLLVGSSLLVWHRGYMRGWSKLAAWSAGFTLAALAALVKGPQAPIYFVAITGAYLLLRRDGRYLLCRQFVVGSALFAVVVAAWQIPFYLATDWHAVVATWAGLAGDRIHLRGVLLHMISYPVETFACLLPWSPLLVALIYRDLRTALREQAAVTVFLITAIVLAYPTVWLASGARGRYFMPIYPLVAVLIAMIVERCATALPGSYPHRAWRQFVLGWCLFIGGSAFVVAGAALLQHTPARRFYQPIWFALAYAAVAATAVYVLWIAYRNRTAQQPLVAVLAICLVAGLGAAGLMINVNAGRWLNPTSDITDLKKLLPANVQLVSLSPIEHRFAYYYRDAIPELDWPRTPADLPQGVDYFCFMRQPGDTAAARASGRGRSLYKTPGTLPFAWHELATVCVERAVYDDNPRVVVIGRVERPLRAMTSDVTIRSASHQAIRTKRN